MNGVDKMIFEFLFGPKDIYQRITMYAEDGKIGKLERLALKHENELVRAAACRAMGKIRVKETIDFIFDRLRSDDTVKVKKGCAQALEKVATRSEFDAINHFADETLDPDLRSALQAAAVAAKERTPSW